MQIVEVCPINEYHEGLNFRVEESQLTVGGIYIAMFNLRNNGHESLRYNARIENIQDSTAGDRRIDYVAIDEDFKPFGAVVTGNIHNGVIDFTGLRPPFLVFTDDPSKYVFKNGFLKDYHQPSGIDQELKAILDAEALASV